MAVINGTAGNDALVGTSEADTINGFGGNDSLLGLGGADRLEGFTGFDTARYDTSPFGVTVFLDGVTAGSGGHGAGDVLVSIEAVLGSDHNDLVNGFTAGELLMGGGGDDILKGAAGDDTLIGGAGADRLDGGADSDRVEYEGSPTGVQVFLSIGGGDGAGFGGHAEGDRLRAVELATGSPHGDVLVGDGAFNSFFGGAGDDLLFGAPDATGSDGDSLDGGEGNDAIWGYGGADAVWGRDGDDSLIGGFGNDTLFGEDGDDQIYGGEFTMGGAFALGSGADIISAGNGDDTAYGFDGDDRIGLGRGSGAPGAFQYADGGAGDDTITSGPDANAYLIGGAGADRIGGTVGGFDYIWGDDPANPAVSGADLHQFAKGASFDEIFDFRIADGDRLEIATQFGFIDFASLVAGMAASSGGMASGYTIFLSDTGMDRLVVHGVSVGQWTSTSLGFFTPD